MIAPSFIERLCQGVHLRQDPKRLFLMLGIYIDESGTHGGSPRTVNSSVWRFFVSTNDLEF